MSNNSLRVAMLSHNYYPLLGGAERQLGALAPLLQARDIEVHILTRRYPDLAAYEEVNGVPVHRLFARKPLASPLFTLSALPILRRLKPDVIHAYSLFSPLTTAVFAKRLFGTPVVVKILRGGTLGDLIRLQNKRGGASRVSYFKRQVDTFISISAEITAELSTIGIPTSQQAFIPNGVDTTRFQPLSSTAKTALRQQLNLPADAVIAVYSGRLVPEKRVDLLLETWQSLRTANPHMHLLIIGSGQEEAALRAKTGAGVQWVGYVEDVAPYLQASDMFVLPSVSEGLSNALLEAMASGLACVVTPVGGAVDVINDGANGVFVAVNDGQALHNALLMLSQDANLRQTLGQAARTTILDRYALDQTADQLAALYHRLARR